MMNSFQYVDSVVASSCVSNNARNGEPRELLLRGNRECEKCLSQLQALGVIGVRLWIQQFDDGDKHSVLVNTYFAKGVRRSASRIAKVKVVGCLLSACLEEVLRASLAETDAKGLEMNAMCHVEQGVGGWSVNAYVTVSTSELDNLRLGIKLL